MKIFGLSTPCTLAVGAAAAAVLSAHPPSALADQSWSVDPGNSAAAFTVKHFVVSKVHGVIHVVGGSLVTPDGGTVPTSVQAALDPASISTGSPDRDNDLRGPEWLETERYKTMTFKSTAVTPGSNGDFSIAGTLTLHGVTKPVTIAAHFEGSTTDARGYKHAAYSGTTTIDRRDFGLNWARTMPGGALIADNVVFVDLSLEVIGR